MVHKQLTLITAICMALVGTTVSGASAQSDASAGTRFVLSGVVVVEGGGRAWLQEPTLTKNEIVSVRPGDSIGPYRLTKVFDDRVELEGPRGSFAVRLAGPSGPVVASPEPSAPVPMAQVPAPVAEALPPAGRTSAQDFSSFLQSLPRIQH